MLQTLVKSLTFSAQQKIIQVDRPFYLLQEHSRFYFSQNFHVECESHTLLLLKIPEASSIIQIVGILKRKHNELMNIKA